MTQLQYTIKIKRNKGSHLTEAEMNQIQAYKEVGMSNRQIAKKIGCSHQTINNAINNNSVIQKHKVISNGKEYVYKKSVYYADVHLENYQRNRRNCGRRPKWLECDDFINWADDKMNPKEPGAWSPDQCVGRALREDIFNKESVPCTKTLYNWIDAGITKTKNKDLREKIYRRPRKQAVRKANKKVLGESIEKRPKTIEEREEFGHWEIDTVIGKKKASDPVLLTLAERKTRFEWTIKLEAKTAEAVNKALSEIFTGDMELKGKIFKSITSDNGSEFASLAELIDHLKIYFCHPYSSFERGTSENQHRLIRRFIPKGASIGNYSDQQILRMNNWINNYPRKILNYATSEECFLEEVRKLIA